MKPVLFSLVLFLVSFTTVPEQKMQHNHSGINKTLILKLVNEARAKGCNCGKDRYKAAPPVVWNDQLENAALSHATDMYTKNFFSHTSSNGANPGERIKKQGYQWTTYGENIGDGYQTEKDMVEGWLASPGHCRNIMNPDFTEMGAAKVGDYWTQVFARK